jgi:hypothetical protein
MSNRGFADCLNIFHCLSRIVLLDGLELEFTKQASSDIIKLDSLAKGVDVMPQPQIDRDNYNYEDYLSWPEDERWEIIDGMPYLMAPPSRIHQEISVELSRQISNYLITHLPL